MVYMLDSELRVAARIHGHWSWHDLRWTVKRGHKALRADQGMARILKLSYGQVRDTGIFNPFL